MNTIQFPGGDTELLTNFEYRIPIAGPVEVAEVNGPDIKAENDFGVTKVKTATSSATADGRRLRYRFPAHSYTMLRTKLV